MLLYYYGILDFGLKSIITCSSKLYYRITNFLRFCITMFLGGMNMSNFLKLNTDFVNPRKKYIADVVPFTNFGEIPLEYVKLSFDFAYDMTFGRVGQHRAYRTGGTHIRRNGEIFANAFQGKLCEFAIYLELKDKHDVDMPDLTVNPLGEWDDYDFRIDNYNISVKSTKSFGQLLLLEKMIGQDLVNTYLITTNHMILFF